jgi:flagellar basal body-associated protein FliL
MPNDYYDFNPSATTWVLMLSVVVLFTVGLCVLLIVAISRAEASTVRAAEQPDDEALPASAPAKRTGSGGVRPVTTA